MVCPWKKPLLFLSSSALLLTVYSVPPFFPFPLSFPCSLPFLPLLFLPFSYPFSLSPLVLRLLSSPLLFLIFCFNLNNYADPKEHILDFPNSIFLIIFIFLH